MIFLIFGKLEWLYPCIFIQNSNDFSAFKYFLNLSIKGDFCKQLDLQMWRIWFCLLNLQSHCLPWKKKKKKKIEKLVVVNIILQEKNWKLRKVIVLFRETKRSCRARTKPGCNKSIFFPWPPHMPGTWYLFLVSLLGGLYPKLSCPQLQFCFNFPLHQNFTSHTASESHLIKTWR